MSTRDRIRVGIIGAGRIAETHVRYYRQIPWVEVVGVVHHTPGKGQVFAQEQGVPSARAFEDYHDMLEQVDLDAVSICTPNMVHRDPAVDALRAGKHVLLEKPMAVTLDDARDIMRASRAAGKVLMVSLQSAFTTQYTAARQAMESGVVGDVYYAEAIAFRRWGTPGGPFLKKATAGAGAVVDIGVYAIHTAVSLLGNPYPIAVSATTNNYLSRAANGLMRRNRFTWRAEDVEVEDFGAAFIRFAGGAVMVVKACWAAHADSLGRPLLLLGTKGGLSLNTEGRSPPVELYFNQQFGGLNLIGVPQELPEVDAWAAKMLAFAQAVRDDLPSPIDPQGVFLVNVIMDGILRSAACGHEVTVDTVW